MNSSPTDKVVLLPCPFCGDEPAKTPGSGAFYIQCTNELCDIQPGVEMRDTQNAVGAWNKRASLSADRSHNSKLPSLPEEIQEWCWHMDTHLTEHDIRHAGLALRAAWPHVSKWLQENVGPSSRAGTPFQVASLEDALAEANRRLEESEVAPVVVTPSASGASDRVKRDANGHPLHRPEIVEKAVKTANWLESCGATVFLAPKPEYEAEPVHPGQRLWLCRALRSLTVDEILDLHAALLACEIATTEGRDA